MFEGSFCSSIPLCVYSFRNTITYFHHKLKFKFVVEKIKLWNWKIYFILLYFSDRKNANNYWYANIKCTIGTIGTAKYWSGWWYQNLLLSYVYLCEFTFVVNKSWPDESEWSHFGHMLSNVVASFWFGIGIRYWTGIQYVLNNGHIMLVHIIIATLLLHALRSDIQFGSTIIVCKYRNIQPIFGDQFEKQFLIVFCLKFFFFHFQWIHSAGDLLQFVCIVYVLQCFCLHGFHRLILAVSTIRIATRIHGLSSNDSRLCKYFVMGKMIFYRWNS